MKLKLLAPFWSLDFSPVDQWEVVAELFQANPPKFEELEAGEIQELQFSRAKVLQERHSRYRSIATHSLVRSLHSVEVFLRPQSDAVLDLLDESFSSQEETLQGVSRLIDAMANSIKAGDQTFLIRVFNHRISILQFDIDLETLLSFDSSELPDVLDAIQIGAINFVEKLVERYYDKLLVPLFDWIKSTRDSEFQTLKSDKKEIRFNNSLQQILENSCRTLWVSRAIILEKKDGLTTTKNGIFKFRTSLIGHWLKDVSTFPATSKAAKLIIADKTYYSISWVNYFFAEKSYIGEYSFNQHGIGATPFSVAWDAMEIAQYYYAAFNCAQAGISKILSISVSNTHSVNEIQALLDIAIRDVHLLRIEFEENKKYFSRHVAEKLTEIYKGWDFENLLLKPIQQRLDDCRERLQELHARNSERASFLTDILLLAIGVTSVFSIMLNLAQYGRELTQTPELMPFEGTSFNLAQWIAAHSTDAILLASLILSLGFIMIYIAIRSLKSQL